MGKMSIEKGKRGEREASKFLSKLLGVGFKRGSQHAGGVDSPDVRTKTIETSLHVEVKRDERTLSVGAYKALDQAERDSGGVKVPFVLSKKNYRKWVFLINEDHLIDFCREVIRLYEIE